MPIRIVAAAFLMLAAATAFASDASFDQRVLASSQPSQAKVESSRPAAAGCTCHHG